MRMVVSSLTCAVILMAGCGSKETADDATVNVPEPLPGTNASPPAPGAATSETGAAASGGSAAAPAVKAEGFGTLKGRVVYGGDPPAPRMLVAKGDKSAKNAEVCAVNGVPAQELLVDPATKGVQYALVYLPHPTAVKPEAESAAKAATIDLDQKGCMFVPHVLAAMKGATINIKSDDPIGHNVHSLLPNTPFNTNIQPAAEPYVVTPKAGETRPGTVVCDIHTWMKSWWLILNNPYFAVTNAKGEYEIKDAPAGTQKVVVWQEAVASNGFLTRSSGEPITIAPNAETTQDFTIKPDQIRK